MLLPSPIFLALSTPIIRHSLVSPLVAQQRPLVSPLVAYQQHVRMTASMPEPELSEPLPPVGETLRALRVERISSAFVNISAPSQLVTIDSGATFVEVFRSCTPYIKMHQGRVMVIHISSDCLESETLFDQLMEEIAVLALLGVKPVLLVGVHRQIDDGLRSRGLPSCKFHDGVRETSLQTMRIVQEVNGFMRSRVEGALARGRARLGPQGSVGVDVVGGNFFYTAQPVGVRSGIDYGLTGEVRNVDVDKIKQHLDSGEIVLLTGLGYSASGTVFNVRTEQVAAYAAAALGASKIMYMTAQRLQEHQPTLGREIVSRPLQSLRLAEARELIAYARPMPKEASPPSAPGSSPAPTMSSTSPSEASTPAAESVAPLAEMASAEAASESAYGDELVGSPAKMLQEETAAAAVRWDVDGGEGGTHIIELCRFCISAVERGVTRAHILPPWPGAMIQELYTTDGIGTLIAGDAYNGIRLATASDVPGLLSMIEPLISKGILVKRPPEQLALDVHQGLYYVYTRDEALLACAQLKRFSLTHAELGCLVVAPNYRRQGCGDAMLGFLERTASAGGVTKLFALSTHTMQWFMERGFSETGLSELPDRRVAIYDHERGSKIYMKTLAAQGRLFDAEELFWMDALKGKKSGSPRYR